MDAARLEAARKVAFRFLGVSARSVSEIEKRLRKAEFEPEYIEAVVAEAKERGWLDDTKFATDWIDDRADRKGYGKTRLKQELRGKGLDSETIDAAIGEIAPEDEADRCQDVARSRWAKMDREGLDSATRFAEKQRLSQFLLRRGFAHTIIRQVIAQVTANKDTDFD